MSSSPVGISAAGAVGVGAVCMRWVADPGGRTMERRGVGCVVEGSAEGEAAGTVGDSDDCTTGWGIG